MKRWLALTSFVLALFLTSMPAAPVRAESTSKISGTFVKAIYTEVEVDKNTTTRTLSQVQLKNKAGKTTTLAIDKNAKLSVDSRSVKIDAFKLGMKVDATVALRRVKSLSGKTETDSGTVETDGKSYAGIVSYIARNSNSLSVKLDNGQTKSVFYNTATSFYKQTRKTDISSLHEGDRVKISFSAYNSTYVTSLVILDGGVQVAGLYKGTIHRIDPVSRKIILRDEMKYLDWNWQPNKSKGTSSYNYAAKTPFYLDDKPVAQKDMRKYAGHKVYLATVNKFGKEEAERVIIQKNVERTYYEPMQSVNTVTGQVRLFNVGAFDYHPGTILIRNGRFVGLDSLGSFGTAFIIAAGPAKRPYANVIHISNDGFDRPELAGHAIHFGKISSVSAYEIVLTDLKRLDKNAWQPATGSRFDFNNETDVVQDMKSGVVKAPFNLFSAGNYGYFYIVDGEVIAAHLLSSGNTRRGDMILSGRLDGIARNQAEISVRNVSRWMNGTWMTETYIPKMDIRQATFIKNGKVIQPEDLSIDDRLYITSENTGTAKIIKVD